MPSIPPSAKKRQYRGVVFDKDGTLIDLDCFWYGILRHAAQTVIAEYSSLDGTIETELLKLSGFDPSGRSLPDSLIQIGTNTDIAKAWKRKLLALGCSPPNDFVPRTTALLSNSFQYGVVKPLANLPLIFRKIKRRGLFIGVITSDDLIQTEYCLRNAEVFDLVDMVLAADCGFPPKPAPNLMVEIAARWHIPASSILMVGDTENDMAFAKNAGAHGVMVSAGGHRYEREYPCISSIMDVPAFL